MTIEKGGRPELRRAIAEHRYQFERHLELQWQLLRRVAEVHPVDPCEALQQVRYVLDGIKANGVPHGETGIDIAAVLEQAAAVIRAGKSQEAMAA
jgi:hypothetical protein